MPTPQQKPTIADLYPDLTPEELREADERLREYIEIIIQIAQQIQQDPEKRKLFAELTGIEDERTVNEDIIDF